MSDDELLALRDDLASLSEEAQPIFLEELRHRNLTQQHLSEGDVQTSVPQSTLAKSSFASSFLGIAFIALVISFLLKALGLPFEVNLPITLVWFFVWYYFKQRRRK